MAKSPPLSESQTAKMLPILWLVFILIFALVTYIYFASGAIADNFIEPLKKQLENLITTYDESALPSIAPVLTASPSHVPTNIVVKKSTPTPKKVAATCYRLNIREGEFASNKCYLRSDYDNLIYYLQRFDSAKFDLQTAQGTINITCNCRVAQECEFFKDSCSQAQQQKSQAEADINKYRSMIQSIIARGK
jgi:hypothetical protein